MPLHRDPGARDRQLAAFARLDAVMGIGGDAPATRAADIVLAAAIARGRARCRR